ncbi:hypothetical protein DL95DRAFT_117241 [Leptodontidium sp. 2 PMI_412]|nr:hypothetical protein DL95DRAFT_117241 [Leptodontidium sp. 2 PMI_412]
MANNQTRVAEVTRNCLTSIRSREANNRAPAILVMGRTGAGKSSTVENVTGATGLSGNSLEPVTTECQIASADIDGQEYFLIDTPGFDDEATSREASAKIVRLIDDIRAHISMVGVWYVVDNTAARSPSIEGKLIEWLTAFCGEDYYSSITFVTTHWEFSEAQVLAEWEEMLQRRKLVWARFLDGGAETYQHGKIYGDNEETSQIPTLSWRNDKPTLCTNARDMLLRRCQDANHTLPRIIQELNEGRTAVETTAAKVFGHPNLSNETTAPPAEPGFFWGLWTWAQENIRIEFNNNTGFSAHGPGFSATHGFENFSPHFRSPRPPMGSHTGSRPLDPARSIRDYLTSRGEPNDLAYRRADAQSLGIIGTPGEYNHNRAYLIARKERDGFL